MNQPRLLPAGAQWCGQHDAGCVDGLVETLLLDPSAELSDQNRGHPLVAQLLMNTQEFDLRHALLPAGEHVLSIRFETHKHNCFSFCLQVL